MNKILVFTLAFLLILTITIFLLKPKKCPKDKPYLENGKCVNACTSGKRDDKKCLTATQNCPTARSNLSDGVCVAACPTDKPAVISGACRPCSSNTDDKKFNNNGVCVSACPTTGNIYNNNGICVAACPSGKRDGNNCVASCPTDKPAVVNGVCSPCSSNTDGKKFNNNGVCVAACPTTGNIYNNNDICVAACPTDKPAVISGACRPCSSNTDDKKFNNNGVCVSACPTTGNIYNNNGVCVAACPSGKRDGNNCVATCPSYKPVVVNGVCSPCPLTTQAGFEGVCKDIVKANAYVNSTVGAYGGNWSNYSYDNNYNTLWNPSAVISAWLLFRYNTPTNITGFNFRFYPGEPASLSAESPQVLTIYKNIDPSLAKVESDITPPTSNIVYTKSFTSNPNREILELEDKLNLTGVTNLLVKFSKRTFIYEMNFF